MAKKEDEKTNVMRVLDQKKITYKHYCYIKPGIDVTTNGVEIANLLGENVDKVFKTLVTVAKSGQHYVFMVPVARELDLKKAAKAVREKSIDMIPQKELLPLTGYIHGGCSPIGMKKHFPTFIHETAINYKTIFVSAGKVGCQIELKPADLIAVAKCTVMDIAQ